MLALLAVLAGLASAVLGLPVQADNAVATVWTFPNETWIENLAVRQSGGILCTSLSNASIYLVDPFEHTAITVWQFDARNGVTGIAEIRNDVFVIVTADTNLKTSTAVNGSTKAWMLDMAARDTGLPSPVTLITSLKDALLPDGVVALPAFDNLVLIADASKGVIWRLDTTTGNHSIAIAADVFLPANPELPLGVDGLRLFRDQLYFTNPSANILGRVRIDERGNALDVPEVIANLTFPDDLAISGDGLAYPVGSNTLWRVAENGIVDVIAGGANDTTLEGATSAQFGRTRQDEHVLYVVTNGGMLAPVDGKVHGGQVLAINVGLFD